MSIQPAPGPSVTLLVEPRLLADMLARLLRAAGADVTLDPQRTPVDLVIATPGQLQQWHGDAAPVVVVAGDVSRPGPTILGTQGTLVHDLQALLAAVGAVATSD